MNVKIYLGENVVIGTNKINRYKIVFSGNPSNLTRIAFDILKNGSVVENIDKTFNTTTSDVSNTIIGPNPSSTAAYLLVNLETYNTNSITTYSLSDNNNASNNKDLWIDVVGDISDVFTFTLISNTTSGKATLVNSGTASTSDITEVNYNSLDLYKDENVELTSKLTDIEKLSNVFTDFSNSFTIPATSNNNELLAHYYDFDIDNTFNANILVDGYIEIDSLPFRYGKIQLEGVKLKKQRPDSYKITFYGGLLQLSELFGDDPINLLDYVDNVKKFTSLSQYDYEYTEANLISTLNDPTFKDGNVITPLIFLADRDINYNTLNSTDIGTTGGAINDIELRPALRVARILDAIETRYDISFTNDFFGTSTFNNLFLWLNRNSNPRDFVSNLNKLDFPVWEDLQIDGRVVTYAELLASFPNPPIGTVVYEIDNNIQWAYDPSNVGANSDGWYNTGITPLIKRLIQVDDLNIGAIIRNNYIKLDNTTPYTKERVEVKYFINADNNDIPYNVEVRDMNDNIIWRQSEISGNVITIAVASNSSGINSLTEEWRRVGYKLYIQSEKTNTYYISTDIKIYTDTYVDETATSSSLYEFAQILLTGADNGISRFILRMKDQLPNMKVVDFFQGIMKQFHLIIRPLSPKVFYINTLDGYYGDGNILDVTPYVDQETADIDRPEIYKEISFKYQKTENVLGAKFRRDNDINDEVGYGDLRAKYNITSKNTLSIDLPFENMLFERLTNSLSGVTTNILIGHSSSLSDPATSQLSINASKPIMFFNNGLANINSSQIILKWINNFTTFTSTYVIGNTNDELLDQVTDTINWGAEIDPWHLQEVANSLYLNYWSNWISTIYDLKQRKITYAKTILPPRFVDELSINDRLLIGDQRYKINDYTVNLTNGETKFTLFKDIYDNLYEPEPVFNGKSFVASNMYLTDFTKADSKGSYWLYGSFTTYDGQTATRVIKLNADGTQDRTFLTNLGGPNSNPFALVTLAPYSDGRLLVGGFFTQYNGTARNRIARLNPNGTLDTTFSIGTGFNSSTQKVLLQDDGNILVTGAFSSYNGTSRNRLVRLGPTGTLDTTLSIGTGFNNVTLDAFQGASGSYYVAGYFTQYNGATANHVVKIGATGAIDNTFTTGATAFSPGGNNRVIGLLEDTNSTSFWVYGYDFTSYQGNTAGRIIKLTETGSKDVTFEAGTGFNASVNHFRWTDSGDLFASGAFTNYNGVSTKNAIILNTNGDVLRTFPQTGYSNHYIVGNDVYATKTSNGELVRLTSSNDLYVTRENIVANAGSKYFSFILFSDSDWAVTKVDTGDGTDWVDILTPLGSESSSIELWVDEKASQSAPTVYQPRTMYLKCVSGTVEKWVKVTQNGLIA